MIWIFKIELLSEYLNNGGVETIASKIERLMEFPILYFSDFKRDFKLHYYLNNNLNIVNQRGVFTWNSNLTKPLEHVANAEYADKSNEDNYRFSECININKALAPFVKAKLEDIGVNKGFIYPDLMNLQQTFLIKSFHESTHAVNK